MIFKNFYIHYIDFFNYSGFENYNAIFFKLNIIFMFNFMKTLIFYFNTGENIWRFY